MADITSYITGTHEPHTHIAILHGEVLNVALSADTLPDVVTKADEGDYEIHELIEEVFIPYVPFAGDPDVGAQFLQVIMKRLYNVSSIVAILHNPHDGGESFPYIVCAPYARINKEMHKDVVTTFDALCKHRDIPHTCRDLQYLPLTWGVTTYREGTEIDVQIAMDDIPAIILSVRLNNEPIVNKVKMSASQKRNTAIADSILMHSREEIKGDKLKAKELISLISKDRSRDMSYFLSMGKCLYRIFAGDSDGLELWRDASISEMHILCDEYWPTLDTTCTYYRIHTLQYWASKDSPKQYAEWNSTSVRAALEASILKTGGILDIAHVAYRKNPTLFVCNGEEPKDAVFYRFNGTYYKHSGLFDIQGYIVDTVLPEYEDFLKDMTKIMDSNTDNSFREMMDQKIAKCITIIVKLKDDSFQTKVVRILMRLYNKPNFDNIKDSNPNLTAFEDCIFDAERKCIRDGIPEDHMTCSTGYEFRKAWDEYNQLKWEHPDLITIIDNLSLIIPDIEKREVLRREFASFMHASNPLKRGLLINGPTNNGKSQVYSWISKALGTDYCPDAPNNLLYSEDSHPGNATPHIEMIRNARCLVQMEVGDTHTLDEGLYKRVTGCCDKLTYRGLYQKKISSFVPKCKPHTVCNTFPKINGNSQALRTRTIVISTHAKFITEKDLEYEELKNLSEEECDAYMKERGWHWANLQFNEVIDRTYKAFMWMMIQDFINYSGGYNTPNGYQNVPARKLPLVIQKDTIRYFTKSNIYLQFLQAATRPQRDAPGVTTYSLYNAYKKWYGDTINRFGYASMSKLVSELESMSIKHNNDVYSGLVLTYQ